ncbi:MAG: hypothetical protein RL021_180, partial [Bacteroidota bacterium]
MKKFYFLLAFLFAFGTSMHAQLAMKNAPRKTKQTASSIVAKKPSFLLMKRNAPSAPSTSTVYWSDDFSDSTHWTTTAVVGTDNWVLDYTGTGPTGAFAIAPIASATAANGFALFDSDLLCSGDQTANLETSGTIDLTSATSARLVFSQYYRRFVDSTFLFVSNDSGTTWTKIALNETTANNNYNSTNQTTGTNPDIVSVDITSIAAGYANVKIRFQFYSPTSLGASAGCAYAWMIDDVSIENVPSDDIAVAEIADPSQYSSTPILQVRPLTLGGRITNLGSSVATNASITIDIFDGNFTNLYNSVTTAAASINPGDTSALLTAS